MGGKSYFATPPSTTMQKCREGILASPGLSGPPRKLNRLWIAYKDIADPATLTLHASKSLKDTTTVPRYVYI